MSNLPEIDALKVAQRELEKLRQQILVGFNRESKLEIVAEAIRDERDAAIRECDELRLKLDNIQNNTVKTPLQNDVVIGETLTEEQDAEVK